MGGGSADDADACAEKEAAIGGGGTTPSRCRAPKSTASLPACARRMLQGRRRGFPKRRSRRGLMQPAPRASYGFASRTWRNGRRKGLKNTARVAELVYATDLKSVAPQGLTGSSPVPSTTFST